jgi:amidase
VITEAVIDGECRTAWEDASRLLEELGHEVVDVGVPVPRSAVPCSRPAGRC